MHAFFEKLQPQELTSQNFDSEILDSTSELKTVLKVVFMWGNNCPNCEVAKNILAEHAVDLKKYPHRWYHINVYENMDIATRFGLHGIPVFFFFQDGKKLGRFTSFPGWDEFHQVLEKWK